MSTPEVFSVGGSVATDKKGLFEPFAEGFAQLCKELTADGTTIIAVVGGGDPARQRRDNARLHGVTDQIALDNIGIIATQENAAQLHQYFLHHGVSSQLYVPGQEPRLGVVEFRGGDTWGHTTDFVAVKAAIASGAKRMINISSVHGLFPMANDLPQFDQPIIETISSTDYLMMFTKNHEPGQHIPMEPQAVRLAQEHGIEIILVGSDFDNLRSLLNEESFEGTVIKP